MAVAALLALLFLAQPPPPGLAIEQFFIGTVEGRGTVNVRVVGRRPVRDHMRGHRAPDGALILDQIVEHEGEPTIRRTWRLVRAGGNRITGTISDATGPVTGELSANSLRLRYRRPGGFSINQRITLAPDGRTATNRMTIRRFRVRMATVETVIRRVE